MRFKEFNKPLQEAPIGDWDIDSNFDSNEKQMISQFHGYSQEKKHWPDADKIAIKNPEVIKKIKIAFDKTPFHFNLYFYQSSKPDYDRTLQKGLVDLAWIEKEMSPETAKQISKIAVPGAITVLMTNNLSDESWISIRSPWLIAHRIAHGIIYGENKTEACWVAHSLFEEFTEKVTNLAYGIEWPKRDSWNGHIFYQDYQDVYMKLLGHTLGTMRSAREKKLVQPAEWVNETFAQYIIAGNVKINPLPMNFDESTMTTDPKKLAKLDRIMKQFPIKVEKAFATMLSEATGHIWVI